MTTFYILWPIFCGVVIPLLIAKAGKGIHIHIHKEHKQEEKKVEYNESLTKMLPPEVQQYYANTNGQNKF